MPVLDYISIYIGKILKWVFVTAISEPQVMSFFKMVKNLLYYFLIIMYISLPMAFQYIILAMWAILAVDLGN